MKASTRFVLRCDGAVCENNIDVDVEATLDRITVGELDDVIQPLVLRVAARLGWKDHLCPRCAKS